MRCLALPRRDTSFSHTLRAESQSPLLRVAEPKDVLATDIPVAQLRLGDLLISTHAGAYAWHISIMIFSDVRTPSRFSFVHRKA